MVDLDNISVIVAFGAIGGHDEALHSVWLQLLHGPGGVHMCCTEFTCSSEHKISFKYVWTDQNLIWNSPVHWEGDQKRALELKQVNFCIFVSTIKPSQQFFPGSSSLSKSCSSHGSLWIVFEYLKFETCGQLVYCDLKCWKYKHILDAWRKKWNEKDSWSWSLILKQKVTTSCESFS